MLICIHVEFSKTKHIKIPYVFFFLLITMTEKIKKTFYRFFSDVFIDVTIFLFIFAYAISNKEKSIHHTIGIIIAVLWLGLWILSRIHLGDAFSVQPQAKKLVQNGIYSKIRHPIYIFSLVAFSGVVLALGKPIFFFIMMWFFLIGVIRAKKERKILHETFWEEYKKYRKKTWF